MRRSALGRARRDGVRVEGADTRVFFPLSTQPATNSPCLQSVRGFRRAERAVLARGHHSLRLMIAPRPSPPRPSPLLRFLRRLAITAGVGAAIALVIRLYELYLKPRLMPPEEEARNLPAPSISKRRPSELSSSCAAAAVAWASSARSRKSSYAKPYAAFISHMKAETSMESRFIQTELESKLGRKCFLDSDDLRDLSDLTQHVRDSDVLAR